MCRFCNDLCPLVGIGFFSLSRTSSKFALIYAYLTHNLSLRCAPSRKLTKIKTRQRTWQKSLEQEKILGSNPLCIVDGMKKWMEETLRMNEWHVEFLVSSHVICIYSAINQTQRGTGNKNSSAKWGLIVLWNVKNSARKSGYRKTRQMAWVEQKWNSSTSKSCKAHKEPVFSHEEEKNLVFYVTFVLTTVYFAH